MDVADFLRKLGLEQYAPAFRENKIGPDLLPRLTAEDVKDLGVTLVGDRRVLLDAIASMREPMPPLILAVPETPASVPILDRQAAPTTAEAERRQVTVMF
jgi:hypothetical protein